MFDGMTQRILCGPVHNAGFDARTHFLLYSFHPRAGVTGEAFSQTSELSTCVDSVSFP